MLRCFLLGATLETRPGAPDRPSRRGSRRPRRQRRRHPGGLADRRAGPRRLGAARAALGSRGGARPESRRERLESVRHAHAIRTADRGTDRRLPAARGPHAPANARRVHRPGAPAGGRSAAASPADRGRRALDGAVGPAGQRQDDARAARGRRLPGAFHRAVRGGRGRQGHPRGGRGGARGAARRRPSDRALPRRGAPLQQGAAGHVPAVRRGRHARLHRCDDRESVVRAQFGAAVAGTCLPAEGARARGPRGTARSARSPTSSAGSGPMPSSRRRRRSNAWPKPPTATRGAPSTCSKSPPTSRRPRAGR